MIQNIDVKATQNFSEQVYNNSPSYNKESVENPLSPNSLNNTLYSINKLATGSLNNNTFNACVNSNNSLNNAYNSVVENEPNLLNNDAITNTKSYPVLSYLDYTLTAGMLHETELYILDTLFSNEHWISQESARVFDKSLDVSKTVDSIWNRINKLPSYGNKALSNDYITSYDIGCMFTFFTSLIKACYENMFYDYSAGDNISEVLETIDNMLFNKINIEFIKRA